MKLGTKYYLYFLPTLVCFLIASLVFRFSVEDYISFLTAISFAGLYCHPNREEYFEHRKGRLNFANVLMNFFSTLERYLPDNWWGNFLLRQLPGFIFFVLISFVGFKLTALILYIVGVSLFELTFYVYVRNISKQIDQDEF